MRRGFQNSPILPQIVVVVVVVARPQRVLGNADSLDRRVSLRRQALVVEIHKAGTKDGILAIHDGDFASVPNDRIVDGQGKRSLVEHENPRAGPGPYLVAQQRQQVGLPVFVRFDEDRTGSHVDVRQVNDQHVQPFPGNLEGSPPGIFKRFDHPQFPHGRFEQLQLDLVAGNGLGVAGVVRDPVQDSRALRKQEPPDVLDGHRGKIQPGGFDDIELVVQRFLEGDGQIAAIDHRGQLAPTVFHREIFHVQIHPAAALAQIAVQHVVDGSDDLARFQTHRLAWRIEFEIKGQDDLLPATGIFIVLPMQHDGCGGVDLRDESIQLAHLSAAGDRVPFAVSSYLDDRPDGYGKRDLAYIQGAVFVVHVGDEIAGMGGIRTARRLSHVLPACRIGVVLVGQDQFVRKTLVTIPLSGQPSLIRSLDDLDVIPGADLDKRDPFCPLLVVGQ